MLHLPSCQHGLRTANISTDKESDKTSEAKASFAPKQCLYTDGSKTLSGTGAAVFINDTLSITARLKEPSSIFDAELLAIMLATEHIRKLERDRYMIVSDSLSVLMALQNNSVSSRASPTLYRCRHRLHILSIESYQILLIWVPSYKDIAGNEKADERQRNQVSSATYTCTGSTLQHHSIHHTYTPGRSDGTTENWVAFATL